jgi:hypothetical protein
MVSSRLVMIHRRFRLLTRIKRTITGTCAPLVALAAASLAGSAGAGEFDRGASPATLADPARCDGDGHGPAALRDTDGCLRINGYIAAGARFVPEDGVGGRSAPFGPLDGPGIVTSVGASRDPAADALLSPDRFLSPANQDDEAR